MEFLIRSPSSSFSVIQEFCSISLGVFLIAQTDWHLEIFGIIHLIVRNKSCFQTLNTLLVLKGKEEILFLYNTCIIFLHCIWPVQKNECRTARSPEERSKVNRTGGTHVKQWAFVSQWAECSGCWGHLGSSLPALPRLWGFNRLV